MIGRSSGRCTSLVVALVCGLLIMPDADAQGGRPRGRAPRAPAHHSAPHQAGMKAPRMPHPTNNGGARPHVNASTGRVNSNTSRVATNNHPNANRNTTRPSTAATRTASAIPHTTVYGTGNGTRHYRPRGYGRGYQNHYVGYRGYGRSQGNNRSIVSRLRSVHSTLARIDHDYKGHRVRAMHQISRAINLLSHRSTSGFNNGLNGTRLTTSNNNGLRTNRNSVGNVANRNGTRLSQAQSDARMSQALRTTQGISSQLANQGQNHYSHRRAHAYLQQAVREMNIGLTVR